jgi:hypothetical protein
VPLVKLNFSPGVFKDDTPLTAEEFYTDADKVRFWRGKAETIGGWEKAATTAFVGMARGLQSWLDTTALAWAKNGARLSVLDPET